MRLQQRQEKVQEKLSTISNDEKPPVDVFKSIFSDSDSDDDSDEKDDESEKSDDNETLTISKAPPNPPPENSSLPDDKKLSWNRFSAPPIDKTPKTEPPNENNDKMDVDDFEDRPKFTFTAKKDRKTTKKVTDVKIENPNSDSGMFSWKNERLRNFSKNRINVEIRLKCWPKINLFYKNLFIKFIYQKSATIDQFQPEFFYPKTSIFDKKLFLTKICIFDKKFPLLTKNFRFLTKNFDFQ